MLVSTPQYFLTHCEMSLDFFNKKKTKCQILEYSKTTHQKLNLIL